jgi:CRISPR system Cascade subunit CasD
MSILLLRLSGVMQSWGTQSNFNVRDTGLEPSKSGVIGLLCAALGRPRRAAVTDLVALGFGVRVDQEGTVECDYQIIQNILRARGGRNKKAEVSHRYYLADARFLVGLEGDALLLSSLYSALRNPHWPLCLGRKAFVPGEPIWLSDGLRQSDECLEAALRGYPWLGNDLHHYPSQVRLVLDDPDGADARLDAPLSFVPFADRRFTSRHVRTMFIPAPLPLQEEQNVPLTVDTEPA